MNTQRIILAGGSGFLGQALARHFLQLGWEVVVLSRHPQMQRVAREVAWDAESVGEWSRELEGAAAVVNLTGRTVDCRYTATNRRLILESRVNSTQAIGQAIAQCAQPPGVWLNSSSATIYRHTFGPSWDESGADFTPTPAVKDAFSVEVIHAWERALNEAVTPRTRKVALRTTLVLGQARNSVFPVLRRLARLGLG
ncbi:MAG: NAD-dependent epimerase/dehydratase family protein, partial [Verrucomicrobia bacterium]|nr:NAD-dependent epimerase/dehydratase family protein [Verrucomicrobiota bacterium]